MRPRAWNDECSLILFELAPALPTLCDLMTGVGREPKPLPFGVFGRSLAQLHAGAGLSQTSTNEFILPTSPIESDWITNALRTLPYLLPEISVTPRDLAKAFEPARIFVENPHGIEPSRRVIFAPITALLVTIRPFFSISSLRAGVELGDAEEPGHRSGAARAL
jgi:hypothetical protein